MMENEWKLLHYNRVYIGVIRNGNYYIMIKYILLLYRSLGLQGLSRDDVKKMEATTS